MPKVLGRIPTVPEYYQEFINKSVDLIATPKQCCPFHEEKTPSFSYNIETGRWTCFGRCHASGDVIEMHRRFYKLESKEEAIRSLCAIYEVERKADLRSLALRDYLLSPDRLEDNSVYLEACRLANTKERWQELDYEMSKTPFERIKIEALINQWKGTKSALDMTEEEFRQKFGDIL